jgi:hypothetical protein
MGEEGQRLVGGDVRPSNTAPIAFVNDYELSIWGRQNQVEGHLFTDLYCVIHACRGNGIRRR